MSLSTRSDLLSHGQADLSTEAALQQVTTERNSLRSQNDQLWKIIEKQRIIIQNQQKDIAKLTTERDLLRHLAAEHENLRNGASIAQVNGHQQKRSVDKKAQECETTTPVSEPAGVNGDTDNKLALVSTSTSVDSRPSLESPRQRAKSEANRDQQLATCMTPVNDDSDLKVEDERDYKADEGGLSMLQDDEVESQASYDPEIQVATSGNRVQYQTPSATSPPLVLDRDARTLPAKSDLAQPQSGNVDLLRAM